MINYFEIVLVFVLGVVFGGLVTGFWYFRKRKGAEGELAKMQKELEKEKEILGGFEEYNKKISQVIAERKQRILEELKSKGRVDAGKVSALFEVSRHTAFRYLEELEKEGRIEQVGVIGRGVEYRAK